MDPPGRNPLLTLSPHFMKSLYTHWQFTHSTQETVPADEVCMDPTHPDEGLPSRPPSELSDTARLRLQEALTVTDWPKTDTQPMQPSEVEDMLREAYSLADLDFGVIYPSLFLLECGACCLSNHLSGLTYGNLPRRVILQFSFD